MISSLFLSQFPTYIMDDEVILRKVWENRFGMSMNFHYNPFPHKALGVLILLRCEDSVGADITM